MAKSPEGSQEKPWVTFQFSEPTKINRLRLGSNREDFLETDYINGLHNIQYGDFRLEVEEEPEKWQPFFSTLAMKKKSSEDQQRKALQKKVDEVVLALIEEGPQPAFVARFVEPVETFVFARGSPESPRDQVFAAAPSRFHGDLGIRARQPRCAAA